MFPMTYTKKHYELLKDMYRGKTSSQIYLMRPSSLYLKSSCPTGRALRKLFLHLKILLKGQVSLHFSVQDIISHLDRVKRIWYLSPMRAAKVQASLRIRAVSPEPPLLAHTSSESRGTFRQKTRSLAPLNGWACAVKICHDGMLEDTNSLDGAHLMSTLVFNVTKVLFASEALIV